MCWLLGCMSVNPGKFWAIFPRAESCDWKGKSDSLGGGIVPPVKKMVATAEFVYVGMKGNLFSFTYEVV